MQKFNFFIIISSPKKCIIVYTARKNLDRYLANIDSTGKRDDKFQYNVGLFQFGKNYENIAAAICLFAISFLISGIPS